MKEASTDGAGTAVVYMHTFRNFERRTHSRGIKKTQRERETDDKDIDRGRDLVMETLQPLVTYSKKNV